MRVIPVYLLYLLKTYQTDRFKTLDKWDAVKEVIAALFLYIGISPAGAFCTFFGVVWFCGLLFYKERF